MPRREVEFHTGLPRGTCATFKHEGELWIAHPVKKYVRILTCLDRVIGVQDRIVYDMTTWINNHPSDAPLLAMLAESVGRARRFRDEVAQEKCEAATM